MSSPTELLPGTSIAATSWATASGSHVRVYTQDINGGIRESRFESGTWSGGTANDVIAKAKPNSPIATFNYGGGAHIRVYYLSAENIIQEICQDDGGKWFAGNLNFSNFKTSPVSRLTVIGSTWDGHNITLYYQRPDEAIGEIRQDGFNWVLGGTVGEKPMLGTGLAAVTFQNKGIRLYYQLPTGILAEAAIDKGGKWYRGGLPKVDSAAPVTNIAAYTYGADPNLQVYFMDKKNTPVQWAFYSRDWHGPSYPGQTTTSPGSGAAIVPFTSPTDLRFYVQDDNNRIQEFVSAGSNWSKGALVPTGGLQ